MQSKLRPREIISQFIVLHLHVFVIPKKRLKIFIIHICFNQPCWQSGGIIILCRWQYNYLRGTDSLVDIFILFWSSRNIDINVFWVSDIFFFKCIPYTCVSFCYFFISSLSTFPTFWMVRTKIHWVIYMFCFLNKQTFSNSYPLQFFYSFFKAILSFFVIFNASVTLSNLIHVLCVAGTLMHILYLWPSLTWTKHK